MINYNNIADSIDFYTSCGYQRIEAPWTVSEYVDDITRPKDRPHLQLKHNGKCLVASGEQSFLYLYLKEYLPLGKYQTVTPCFRFEPYNLYHEKTFIKNELIITDNVNAENLDKIINDAFNFFKSKLDKQELLKIVKADIGYDIEYNGIELGSYGIRKNEYLTWIYGTGCAEPRLSKIQTYFRNE